MKKLLLGIAFPVLVEGPEFNSDKTNSESATKREPVLGQCRIPNEPVKCPGCGKKVDKVFSLTADDIQRQYSPDDIGIYMQFCSTCRDTLRRSARLEVRYGSTKMLRDSLIATPILFGGLLYLTSLHIVSDFLITAVIFLTVGASALREVSERYSFTHNLAWSLRNRRVTLGISGTVAIALTLLSHI